MTDDPNADLIGSSVTIDGQEFTVVGTAAFSEQYVLLQNEDERGACRPAAVVRRHLQLAR